MYFGFSVPISGDYAIVGASEDNSTGSGSAYIFE
ncbi:MAG: FG-GAP repeat protein [Spirochaetes bacterium]|nr:FG-GAP repeat protein [Spirochaetota bacterium]